MIITIDGPAGSGKSSVAKRLAKKLSFAFFESGAMYRALTLSLLTESVDWGDEQALDDFLEKFSYQIDCQDGQNRYLINGIDVSSDLRSQRVNDRVSEVSALPRVRMKLLGIQHDFAKNGNCVFEGRDMGSTVFPHAELKFYLSASVEVRAKRRHEEILEKDSSSSISLSDVKQSIEQRDKIDTSRKFSPLRKAPDAIDIDSSNLGLEEVIDHLMALCKEKINF